MKSTKQQQHERIVERFPHHHETYFRRPDISRRGLLQMAGGLAGSFLFTPTAAVAAPTSKAAGVTPINKAENVIFILLTGAPSHTDTFDFKMVNGVTPASFNPARVNGVMWPTGLLPKMSQQMPNMAIMRSVQSWALVHTLAQVWSQIGRSPAAALGDIAPNIGSIVAIEKGVENSVFPPFLALNAAAGVGSGYLSTEFAPFRVNYGSSGTSTGIPNTTNTLGESRFKTLTDRMQQIDGGLRQSQSEYRDYDQFYSAARRMMYNNTVQSAFSYTSAESAAYGSSSFGNACLVAKKALRANQGTKFVQINFGSWDHHNEIYAEDTLPAMAKQLDAGYAQLLADLKNDGLLDKTLVVMTGEFGRTVGKLSGSSGRDHWKQQSTIFAGAGVKGGRALGETDATGADTVNYGWSEERYVRPEDIEATIYSAMGIDWTTVRYDDPFGRGFEYVPFGGAGLYRPIDELWK